MSVLVVEATEHLVLRGPDWDDPADWEGGVLPTMSDSVFVAAGDHVATELEVVELLISSNATLVAGGTVRASLFAGSLVGELRFSSGGGMAAGRVTDFILGDGAFELFGSLHVTGDLTTTATGGLALMWMQGRLTVDGTMTIDGGPALMFGLQMMTPGATLDVTGDLVMRNIVGGPPEGLIWARSDRVILEYIDPPGPLHQLFMANRGPVMLDVNMAGTLVLGVGAELTLLSATNVMNVLMSERPTTATAPVVIDRMSLGTGFTTTTPGLFTCAQCVDDLAGALCATLPSCNP